ncbi:MAG: transporter ATP-binding protein, partial [Chthonomonadales bacterium]|nr:transporter ATP-binding protein [Chthonomonadales bacterium]
MRQRRGGGEGPQFVAGGEGTPPPSPEPEETPLSLRERWKQSRDNGRVILAGLPRACGLVWSAHRGFTITLALMAVVGGALPTATAWITKLLIDGVVAAASVGGHGVDLHAPEVHRVMVLVAVQLGLLLGSALLQVAQSIVQQGLQDLTGIRVQLIIMEHANRLDLAFFENPTFYDKLQQAQSEASYRPIGMVNQLLSLMRSLITFLSMIALIARLGPGVAAMALVAPIPSFIAGTRYGWRGFMQARRQSPDRRRMGYFLDLLTRDTYNKEIKLFGLGRHFLKRWKEIADRFYRENQALFTRRALMGFLWGNLTTLVTSGAFLFVALKAIARVLTIGDLTLYTQAVSSVQSSFQSILGSFSSLYEGGLYLNNLFSFLDYEPAIRNLPDAVPLPPVLESGIEFRNVSFTYPGKKAPALDDISFTLALDETIALVGQNGAGKTTIVKLLTRLYDPSEGAIFLNGRDIRDYELESLRQAVGVIFQDYVTYFFSAAENIGVGRIRDVEDRALIEEAAEKSGAAEMIGRLPKVYETTLGRWFDEGVQLSGGEWQKVALARAFMRDAEVLILDEPTASLDARAEYEIFAQMQQLTAGKMALFISHRFGTVRLADRILVLEHGKIKENGTHEELLALGGT